MTPTVPISAALSLLDGALAGVALGWCYFAAVHRSATAYAARGPNIAIIALTLARVAVTATALVFLARLDVSIFIAASVGFLVARTACVRRRWATE